MQYAGPTAEYGGGQNVQHAEQGMRCKRGEVAGTYTGIEETCALTDTEGSRFVGTWRKGFREQHSAGQKD
jgi:hypothetical protein